MFGFGWPKDEGQCWRWQLFSNARQCQTSISAHVRHHKNTKRGCFIAAIILTIQQAHSLPYGTISGHRKQHVFSIAQSQEFCWCFAIHMRLTSKLVASCCFRFQPLCHAQITGTFSEFSLAKRQDSAPFDANKQACAEQQSLATECG